MAATAITVVRPTISGVASPTPVGADVTNGNSVPNTSGLVLTLSNTDATSRVVTFLTPVKHSGYDVADPTVTLTAGQVRNFSKFPTSAFGRKLEFTTTSNLVQISAMAAD